MKTKLLVVLLVVFFTLPVSAEIINFNGFSEYDEYGYFDHYTHIDTQYRDKGIIFGKSNIEKEKHKLPSIFTDSDSGDCFLAPMISMSSGYEGLKGGFVSHFVKPNTDTPMTVKSFELVTAVLSGPVTFEWFNIDGIKFGEYTTQPGINNISVENVASWKTIHHKVTYAISTCPVNSMKIDLGSSLLFREMADAKGRFFLPDDDIFGLDHCALHIDDVVYESNIEPGYGEYVSADGEETVAVSDIDMESAGVQAIHTRATFEHNDCVTPSTDVAEFKEVFIDYELAEEMQTHIESVMAVKVGDNFHKDWTREGLLPASQKGGDDNFTCVGLLEWSAEKAGHRDGQGFISNQFESITVPDPDNLFKSIEIPLLSPQLLYYASKGQEMLFNTTQWVQGFLDPVDFLITDPEGRRLGYIEGLGEINEIPDAFYSGDGDVEQFLIPNVIPGKYTITLVGVNDNAFMAISGTTSEVDTFETLSYENYLADGETVEIEFLIGADPELDIEPELEPEIEEDTTPEFVLIPEEVVETEPEATNVVLETYTGSSGGGCFINASAWNPFSIF